MKQQITVIEKQLYQKINDNKEVVFVESIFKKKVCFRHYRKYNSCELYRDTTKKFFDGCLKRFGRDEFGEMIFLSIKDFIKEYDLLKLHNIGLEPIPQGFNNITTDDEIFILYKNQVVYYIPFTKHNEETMDENYYKVLYNTICNI